MAGGIERDVELVGVTKRFGDVVAVDGISLGVRRGEFLCLLGPSGCGKTTTLRLIAGFERADAGRILIAGRDVTQVPPYRREETRLEQAEIGGLYVAASVLVGVSSVLAGRFEPRVPLAAAVVLLPLGIGVAGLGTSVWVWIAAVVLPLLLREPSRTRHEAVTHASEFPR